MLFSGVLTAIGIVVVVGKFSRNTLEKILGYDYIFDGIITLGLPVLFAGTYSGVMTGIVTGLSISFILWVAKNTIGYQKYEKGKWKKYPRKWTFFYLGKKAHDIFRSKITEALDDLKRGWNGVEENGNVHRAAA